MRWNYVLGISLTYLGLVFLILRVCVDPWVLSHSLRFQVCLVALVFLLFGGFAIFVVGAQAPIVFQSYAMKKGEYPPGTSIAGITWDSHLTDLRVAITNPTDDDYENLDVEVQPDKWTYKAALSNSPGCDLVPMGGNLVSFSMNIKGGATSITATRVGTSFDAQDNSGDIFTTLATESGYRLRCAKMSARFTVQIVFAVVALGPSLVPPPDGPKGSWGFTAEELAGVHSVFELLGPRPSPSLVRLNGRYIRNLKPFKIAKTIHVEDGN
jgi:hypothetical protein